MARRLILSKRVSFSLRLSAAAFCWSAAARAQSPPLPLVVPYGPLLPADEGWYQEGELVTQAMGAAGQDAWLTASAFLEPRGEAGQPARMMVRMVRRNGPAFPALPLGEALWSNSPIKVIAGSQGAWAVWQVPQGLKAWWISAETGQGSGSPLLLPGSAAVASFQVAGDGEIGWVVWDGATGQNVATLTASGGPPRVRGQSVFDLNRTALSASGMLAAGSGQLLLVQRSGRSASPGPVVSQLVDANAVVTGAAQVWTTPGPKFGDYFYGVISYGAGWMAVWSQTLTPLLSGNIVYGQELEPGGQPVPAQPAQALFVEPQTGYSRWNGVTSGEGKGVIFAVKNFRQVEGRWVAECLAMILTPGVSPRVLGNTQIIDLGLTNYVYSYVGDSDLGPPAACLRGNQLDLMTADGNFPEHFSHTIRRYDISASGSDQPSMQVSATQATGVQEEPALAWMPGAAIVAWQQKSTAPTGPEIRQRRYFANGTSPDLRFNTPGGLPYSSPDIAANQNRILMVARQDHFDQNSGMLDDDLVGVITENGQAVTSVFKIGYGPGSQRAGCAAPFGEGFCVVWREELNYGSLEYVSRIRAVVLDRNGNPDVPGGYPISTSNDELSAPALAVSGSKFCVVWKREGATGEKVEASIVSYTGSVYSYRTSGLTVFPDSVTTSSPDVAAAGDSFVVTARSDGISGPNAIITATLGYPSSPLPLAGTSPKGREPVLASLGEGGTALFWLDHRTRNRPSTQIWMAVSPAIGDAFGTPVVIQTGTFDRDTLAAEGDGKGRVLLAVKSRALGDEGVRLYQLVPGFSGLPKLTLSRISPSPANNNTASLQINWTSSLLFPASLDTVQTSTDLQSWTTSTGQLTAVPTADFPVALFQSPLSSVGDRFYRLRAAYSAD